jgi:hypothetical protein
MEGIFWGVLVWVAFSAAGLLAAGVAWLRRERWWGLTTAGFVLNGILPVALLCSGASFVIGWLRDG